MASAMTGGTAYKLKTGEPESGKYITLYLYVKPTYNSSTRKTSTKLGLYVTTPSSTYAIGKWSDFGNSKLYNTTFDGTVPASTKGTYWIVSNVTGPTISHADDGSASAVSINWYWDVHSSWGGFYDANGKYSYTAKKQAAKTYTVTFNANGGSLGSVPATITKTHGVDYTITTSKPTRTGYTFKEWNTKSDGTGYSLAAGGKINGNESKTMYAIWKINSYDITYNANGGTPATTTKSLNYNVSILNNAPTVLYSGHSLNGWYTAKSGGTKVSSTTKVGTADATYYAQWTTTTTAVTVPTSLTATANDDNTVTVSFKAPADGTGNVVNYVELFVTYDGTTPSVTNYNYTYKVACSEEESVSHVVSLRNFTAESIRPIFGDDCVGTFHVKARTLGTAGSSYYSGLTSDVSTRLTWHGRSGQPTVTKPATCGDVCGPANSYTVEWFPGPDGINAPVQSYYIRIWDETTQSFVAGYNTNTGASSYTLPANTLEAGHTYRFYIEAETPFSQDFNSLEAVSGPLEVKDITPFSDFPVKISDGNTVPSACINGRTFYINTGTGTVCKFSWPDIVEQNNEIDSYYLSIYSMNSGNSIGFNIGKVNEFYLTSEVLEELFDHDYIVNKLVGLQDLSIDIYAMSKFGEPYSAHGYLPGIIQVVQGSAMYVKVTKGYSQPVMKRAIPFVRDPNSGQWKLAIEILKKNSDNIWKYSDSKYEVLTDMNGQVVYDGHGELIYML